MICKIRKKWRIARLILPTLLMIYISLHVFYGITDGDDNNLDQSSSANQMRFHITSWSLKTNRADDRRIYFHETSGRRSLDLRQSCAVESAAKENPGRSIQLFMQTNRLEKKGPWLSILDQYNNIQVILLNDTDYFANTPLEAWYRQGVWRSSPYQREHFSDYIRMLSQLRGGGLYMDLDFITLKALDEQILWNFFPIEDKTASLLTGSIFHLESGHWIMEPIIRKLAAGYDPNIWANYGPTLITKTMEEHCGFKLNYAESNQCRDVQLLPNAFFFPIPYGKWKTYFQEANEDTISLLEGSYGVHVWNKLSREHPLLMGSNQLYALLAAEHCPLTFIKASEFPLD